MNSIHHRKGDGVPMMYRALPVINKTLLEYFNCTPDIAVSWESLLDLLNADCFSGGGSMSKFTRINPIYTGPNKTFPDSSMFYVWGIYPRMKPSGEIIAFSVNTDFAKKDSIEELKHYTYPTINQFDFSSLTWRNSINNNHISGTGCIASLFMISGYLRGFEKLFVELLTEKRLAHYYIDRIGELAIQVARKVMEETGSAIDCYYIWDDMATQLDLMISPETFREYYLPWYKKLFSLVKQYGCKVFFHICGNANRIIPDLIDSGVDILDPVQVSAREMDLPTLKERFGNHLCFHGGIDVQTMMPKMKPEELTAYTRRMQDLFVDTGGLILGPSHEITEDTPMQNILAVYRPDLINVLEDTK